MPRTTWMCIATSRLLTMVIGVLAHLIRRFTTVISPSPHIQQRKQAFRRPRGQHYRDSKSCAAGHGSQIACWDIDLPMRRYQQCTRYCQHWHAQSPHAISRFLCELKFETWPWTRFEETTDDFQHSYTIPNTILKVVGGDYCIQMHTWLQYMWTMMQIVLKENVYHQ